MNNLVVITGAGISVESGIQPFRGKNGVWEENPQEMATYRMFKQDPERFLSWYYHRFVSCKDALPNTTHEILAAKNIKVITQNVDSLHKKANHNIDSLIEIHGNIHYKRKIDAESIEELVIADWDAINENNVEQEVLSLFNIQPNGDIKDDSYRPHILLFDEYYTELFKYSKALKWILEADTILFMGTSNSVGFTAGALQTSLNKNKNVIVVDPNPAPSFIHPHIELHQMSSTAFCKHYFSL